MKGPVLPRSMIGLSEHDLFSIFYEEAMLITREQESARKLAHDALQDFKRRHGLNSNGNRKG